MGSSNEKKIKWTINILSIAIPLAVAALFGIKIEGIDLSFLPPVYASINALTAITLISALIAIKKGKREVHRKLMTSAILLSVLFLLGYVAYHMTSDPTIYGDLNGDGQLDFSEARSVENSSMLYYLLLISHILLSVIVIPLVLFSYFYAWKGDFDRHKKWVNFSYPIWLYVAISGVIVFIFISPYY